MDAPATTAAPATADLSADTPAPTVTPTPAPINPTAAQLSIIDCHICVRMNRRKPAWKQITPSKMCILCVREYCSMHAAPGNEVRGHDVCEINHETYYRKHRHRWIEGVFATLEDWKQDWSDGSF